MLYELLPLLWHQLIKFGKVGIACDGLGANCVLVLLLIVVILSVRVLLHEVKG